MNNEFIVINMEVIEKIFEKNQYSKDWHKKQSLENFLNEFNITIYSLNYLLFNTIKPFYNNIMSCDDLQNKILMNKHDKEDLQDSDVSSVKRIICNFYKDFRVLFHPIYSDNTKIWCNQSTNRKKLIKNSYRYCGYTKNIFENNTLRISYYNLCLLVCYKIYGNKDACEYGLHGIKSNNFNYELYLDLAFDSIKNKTLNYKYSDITINNNGGQMDIKNNNVTIEDGKAIGDGAIINTGDGAIINTGEAKDINSGDKSITIKFSWFQKLKKLFF